MRKYNLYAIITVSDLRRAWCADLIVASDLKNIRKSLDGTLALIKLPISVQSRDDCRSKTFYDNYIWYRGDDTSFRRLMAGADWTPQDIF